MKRVKIEPGVDETEMSEMITPAEIKSEPMVVPLQTYQHDSPQCFLCFITFVNDKAKERHMRKNHRDLYKMELQQKNTLFICYKCDKPFSSSDDLTLHQATHSAEEKPFHCAYCRKNFFTFTEMNQHRKHECIERQCRCSDCGTLFPSPASLRNHLIAVHFQRPVGADFINTYQCCKCRCGFQTEKELLQHQEKFSDDPNCGVKRVGKKRGRKPKSLTQIVTTDSKKIKQEEETEECKGSDDSTTVACSSSQHRRALEIPCPEADCDLVFPSVTALRAHKRETHGPPPSTCKKKQP